LIEYQWFDLDKLHHMQSTTLKTPEEFELNLLVDVVKKSLDVHRHKSLLIFAESKKSVDKICEVLLKAEIKNLPYY
jgi:hypothetical protein